MPELLFERQFLRELAEWEATASARDRELLEKTLAAIARNPALPGRAPSFYEPERPSWLFRAAAVLIHYRIPAEGEVEFLNLFFRRG